MGIRRVIESHHRLPRDAYRGCIAASFTACVAQRLPLFTEKVIVERFAQILRESSRRHSTAVVLYCFMPDHAHIVLQGRDPRADTWRAMVAFKQRTGYWLKKNSRGVAWQKDFFDRIIRSNDELVRMLRYIADNPVRAALVDAWHEYPFIGSDVYNLGDIFSAA